MDIQRLALTLHPAIITAAYVACFFAESTPVLLSLELAAVWWLWSLYCKAASSRGPWQSAVFAIAAIGIALAWAGALFPHAAQPAMFVGIFAFMIANWLAADALVKNETGKDWLPWWKVLVTFLQVFYLPIGIWFLRGRLQRLLPETPEPA